MKIENDDFMEQIKFLEWKHGNACPDTAAQEEALKIAEYEDTVMEAASDLVAHYALAVGSLCDMDTAKIRELLSKAEGKIAGIAAKSERKPVWTSIDDLRPIPSEPVLVVDIFGGKHVLELNDLSEWMDAFGRKVADLHFVEKWMPIPDEEEAECM